jgi:hypothetical protein
MKIVGVFVFGVLLGGLITFLTLPQKIKIIDETPTTTSYKEHPQTMEAYQQCYNSPFEIRGWVRDGNWFDVQVDDLCKTGKKSFKFGGVTPDKNLLQFSASVFLRANNIFYGAEAVYLRRIFWGLAVGGGVTLNSLQEAGLKLIIQKEF